MRLYCLPFAGGSAAVYHGWAAELPGVDVRAVELPGRGSRRREAPARRLDPLVDALVETIVADSDGDPVALFGHSFGGMIAFEAARRLQHGDHAPRMVFLSALAALHLPKSAAPISALPDGRFLAEIQRYGGTPADVLADPDLATLFLDALRADFEAFDSYRYRPEPALAVPVVVFGGTDDNQVRPVQVHAWRDIVATVRVRLLPGGHFFLRTDPRPLLAELRTALPTSIGSTP